jgi:hypothetical protein
MDHHRYERDIDQDSRMGNGHDGDRSNDWGPWVMVPEDGQPYYEPLRDSGKVYRPRLIAPEHPTLGLESPYASEWQYFDLDQHINAAKVVRQLMGLAGFTADDRAVAGCLYAIIDCLGWSPDLPADESLGGWYTFLSEKSSISDARSRGWDRRSPTMYDWVEPEQTYPPHHSWGSWRLDDDAMILDAGRSHVDLLACTTAEAIMRQLLAIAPLEDSSTIAGLIRAMDDVLAPGSWRRPGGADLGIEIHEVAEHVHTYMERSRSWRPNPEWATQTLMATTVNPYEAARQIGAWEGRVIDAIISRRLPCLRVADHVRIHMDDVRNWAAQPGTDLHLPEDLVARSAEWKQRQEAENACAAAALTFLSAEGSWVGTQADLNAAISPNPPPAGWPSVAQIINLLRRQYTRRRGRPQPVYEIKNAGKRGGRTVYEITVLLKVTKTAR